MSSAKSGRLQLQPLETQLLVRAPSWQLVPTGTSSGGVPALPRHYAVGWFGEKCPPADLIRPAVISLRPRPLQNAEESTLFLRPPRSDKKPAQWRRKWCAGAMSARCMQRAPFLRSTVYCAGGSVGCTERPEPRCTGTMNYYYYTYVHTWS